MVKVEGLTDREIALRKKTSRLMQITEEVLGITSQKATLSSMGSIHLSHRSPQDPGSPIVVSPDINRISVESEPYFDQAMDLARAYEEAIPDSGFTVKKLYER